jgi:hypothetical protein
LFPYYKDYTSIGIEIENKKSAADSCHFDYLLVYAKEDCSVLLLKYLFKPA